MVVVVNDLFVAIFLSFGKIEWWQVQLLHDDFHDHIK